MVLLEMTFLKSVYLENIWRSNRCSDQHSPFKCFLMNVWASNHPGFTLPIWIWNITLQKGTTTFAQIFLKVILIIKMLQVCKTNKFRKYLNWHRPKANRELFLFLGGGGGGHWIALSMCELYIWPHDQAFHVFSLDLSTSGVLVRSDNLRRN